MKREYILPDSKLRIVNVIHHLTRGGGVVVQALNLAKTMNRLNHSAHFITMTTEDQDPTYESLIDNLPIQFVTSHISGIFSPLLLARGLSQLMKRNDFSIIQAFDPIISGLSSVFVKQSGVNIPLVIRLGTSYPDFFYSKYNHPSTHSLTQLISSASKKSALIKMISITERLTLNYADIIVPNCEYLKSIYSHKVSNKSKLKVIRNGVDTTRFSPEGKKYPVSEDNLWLLYVGRIENRKGLVVLLKSLPFVFKRHPSARLLLVGRAPEIQYLHRLQKLAHNLGIDDKVHFLRNKSNA